MKCKLEAALLGLILLAIVAIAVDPYLRFQNNSPAEYVSQKVNDKNYSTNINELKDKFNQDKGKVRLVLLLSPT